MSLLCAVFASVFGVVALCASLGVVRGCGSAPECLIASCASLGVVQNRHMMFWVGLP